MSNIFIIIIAAKINIMTEQNTNTFPDISVVLSLSRMILVPAALTVATSKRTDNIIMDILLHCIFSPVNSILL